MARRVHPDGHALKRSLGFAGAALAALLLVGGCAAVPPPVDGVTAECPVCKHEGDLACLCVRIEPDTPRCECAGEIYYFCSEECRADFAARPERYRSEE